MEPDREFSFWVLLSNVHHHLTRDCLLWADPIDHWVSLHAVVVGDCVCEVVSGTLWGISKFIYWRAYGIWLCYSPQTSIRFHRFLGYSNFFACFVVIQIQRLSFTMHLRLCSVSLWILLRIISCIVFARASSKLELSSLLLFTGRGWQRQVILRVELYWCLFRAQEMSLSFVLTYEEFRLLMLVLR